MVAPYKSVGTKSTPQSEPILGSAQIANSAGGYSFAVDDWKRLDRFLILGSEGGSYYIGERELTRQNADVVIRCLNADGQRVVRRIIEVSRGGQAPKNDPALLALALAASLGDPTTKQLALDALLHVARIGTHLFHFAAYVDANRGWGRGLRSAIAFWYLSKTPEALAKQVTKYAQRDGWSHRDLLRLSHAKPGTAEYSAIFRYVTKGILDSREIGDTSTAMDYLAVVEDVKHETSVKRVAQLITEYSLPREVIPTAMLNEAVIWEALLPQMGLTAMIRNLGNMGKVGLLTSMSKAEATIVAKLSDRERLKAERVHPLAILLAQKVYTQGHGMRGKGAWDTAPKVIDALNDAFYLAFDAVEPTGKRVLLSLDVSGSMGWGQIAGTPLTPREAAAAMALVTARVEPQYGIMAFGDKFEPLNISPRDRLDNVVNKTEMLGMSGTDCSLPMLWAQKRKANVDTFVVYTDSETWAGRIHPVQALNAYRRATGIPAKLVVVGMVSNEFTIADPNDAGMLDVVGFDASAPAVISNFMRD